MITIGDVVTTSDVTNTISQLPALDFSFFQNIDPFVFTLCSLLFVFIMACVVEASLHMIFELIKLAETYFNDIETGKKNIRKAADKVV